MPRETVHDEAGMFNTQVGWSNGSVQVGVTTADGRTLDSTLNKADLSDGVWSNLDRAGLNRLIRLLRKARDSAYGADA